ncbi:EAL domain-containing protein [Devosia sp. WQ 349]|uniref:putative bifunctional diguanylate cyclase/phosphodiesterase n=1 Tax=Devosia sp. WQ 349K1 TaxID=2800329 RepID=UPI00190614A7|nr:EAL domain-containing protein [Devosia sp. WQ 349K1]MBK1793550.1 EAL domain-containing protein [Devosia sp. WQ 349K1]
MHPLRIILAVLVVGFVTAASYISFLLYDRYAALDQAGLWNVTWMFTQAPSEFSRLEHRVSGYAAGLPGVDENEVRLRFDIVVSRLSTLNGREASVFLGQSPLSVATLQELGAALVQVEPMLDDLGEPGKPAEILSILEPIFPKLARLSVDANTWNSANLNRDRRALFDLQWAFTGVAFGLIGGGCLLVGMLLFHNRLLGRAQDVLRQKEQSLVIQNARFDAALQAMSVGLCLLDHEDTLIVYNARFLELFSLDASRDWEGTHISEALEGHLSGGDIFADTAADGESSDDITILSSRVQHMPNGIVLRVSREKTIEGGWVCTFEDITERQRAQDRVVQMARHDALTGMANRLYFWERTAQALRQNKDAGRGLAVLYLDLDRFKEVNDTLGHQVGDELLRDVAARIMSTVDPRDIVARLGGDEFAILHVSKGDAEESCRRLAARLLTVIGEPYLIFGHEVSVSTSIGIALAFDTDLHPDTLMKNADLALYNVKAEGRAAYRFFSMRMLEDLQHRRNLDIDMRQGIELGQFEVHYQPLVLLKTGKIVAGEALLRWRHPERGLVPPGEFIHIAEETGFINKLGEWVLQRACRDALQWPGDISVSVNLSPMQFRDSNLVKSVAAALVQSGLNPSRLELEITESVLLQKNDANLEALRQLKKLGLTIALDDFGTGYSSLSYLQRFPFDKIKIDQSFVRDVDRWPDSLPILQSIASLGKNLGMRTTAEGVETAAQLEIITNAGFIEAQGYYFSRPVQFADFVALVEGREGGVAQLNALPRPA